MLALTGPALVAAMLLALAGAQKLIDPSMTSGALRAMHLPSSPALVRAGAGAELALGTSAITGGGALLWWAAATSYLLFATFVASALRSGSMIGSCGCFGREDTPPHLIHVVLNVVLAAACVAIGVQEHSSPLQELAGHPGSAALLVALSGLGVYLVHAAFVELPRTLAAGR